MSEVTETRDEFPFLDPDADMSPAEVDWWLKRLFNELAKSRIALRHARYAEVQAIKAYKTAREPLKYHADCPQPSRSTGITKDDREDWINARISAEYWDLEGKKVVKQAAEDYSRQIRDQVKCIQSIGANARQAFDIAGRAS